MHALLHRDEFGGETANNGSEQVWFWGTPCYAYTEGGSQEELEQRGEVGKYFFITSECFKYSRNQITIFASWMFLWIDKCSPG